MKKCPKCNRTFQDSSIFCNFCGTELKMMQEELLCSKCGNKLGVNDKFCPCCGAAVAKIASGSDELNQNNNSHTSTNTEKEVDVTTTPNAIIKPITEKATFSFSSGRNPYRDPFPTVTEINAEKNMLTIRQYKTYIFIKFNDHTNMVDINSITNLMTKEEMNKKNLFWVIFAGIGGFVSISNGSAIWGIVMLLGAFGIAKCLLHKKTLFIYFNNGYARIPEENGGEGDVTKLVNYIKQYNPKCINLEL